MTPMKLTVTCGARSFSAAVARADEGQNLERHMALNTDSVCLERQFDALLERVFRAWSSPADLRRWAWGSLGIDVKAMVDFRRGGQFLISTLRPDGSRWAFSGSYTELVPNRRLGHTLHWDAPMGYPSVEERVIVEFAERNGRTTVLFAHEGVPDPGARQEHLNGWANCFDALAKLLKDEPS